MQANFDEISFSDISPEFKQSLATLVPSLLSPENLIPKQISGQEVKAKDLLHYFKGYMKVFNGSELPEPKTILEVEILNSFECFKYTYHYHMTIPYHDLYCIGISLLVSFVNNRLIYKSQSWSPLLRHSIF